LQLIIHYNIFCCFRYVGHHIPKKERQSKLEEIKAKFTNIYVKNLDTEVTLEEFNEIFSRFGRITSAVISTDEHGTSKVKQEV